MADKTFGGTAFRIAVEVVAIGACLLATATPAFAVKPIHGGGGGGGHSTPTGNDISYPQCGSSFPSSPAFGIVGVNDGRANDLNPCLGLSTSYPSYTQSELYWAGTVSTGATTQPKASLYVNTGDPGNLYNGTVIGDWPTSSSSSDPYGPCSTTSVTPTGGTVTMVGENSTACAWQYGYNSAAQDATWLTSAANAINGQSLTTTVSPSASAYPWWLDVETANTWQTGSYGQEMNVADLQGMIAGLQSAGAGTTTSTIGAYSTSYQWDQITGGTNSSAGSLYSIPDWVPGARTLSGAKSNCGLTPFTAGPITVTQWSSNPDGDYAC